MLDGSYSAFNITDDDIEVIGEDGANVIGGATIIGTTGVTIENLSFTDTVECLNTHDTTLTDLLVDSDGATYGIEVNGGAGSTVYIEDPEIHGVITESTSTKTRPS